MVSRFVLFKGDSLKGCIVKRFFQSFQPNLRELSYVRMHPIEGSHTRAVEPSTIKFNGTFDLAQISVQRFNQSSVPFHVPELSNIRLPRLNPVGPNIEGPALPVANQVQNGANGQAQQVDRLDSF